MMKPFLKAFEEQFSAAIYAYRLQRKFPNLERASHEKIKSLDIPFESLKYFLNLNDLNPLAPTCIIPPSHLYVTDVLLAL